MRQRPIQKLAIRGSVRELHAVEVCLGRYLGLLGAVGVSTWVFSTAPGIVVLWIAYLAIVGVLVAIFQPWHRELQLSMDSPVLRMQRVVLGVVPVGSSDYALEGRCLAVERDVVERPAKDDSGLGCLTVFLPFPVGAIVSGLVSSGGQPSLATHWTLCLRGLGHGTEDLAHLKDPHVAAAFLDAVEGILPEHVERG